MTAKYIAKSSAIASRLLGGEMMVMYSADSTFFTLNPVATVVLPFQCHCAASRIHGK